MRDHDDSLSRERWVGGSDEMEEDGVEKTRKHRSKDKSKSSGHREDKDHKSKDRERDKTSHATKDREKESKEVDKDHFTGRDRRKEDEDELEREKNRDRVQERDTDRDYYKDRERKDRSKEKDRERERDRDWEVDQDRVRDKDRRKDKTKEKEREKERDRERENDHDRSRNVSEKDKIKERIREKEKESDRDNEKPRDKDARSHKQRDDSHERSRDLKLNDKSRTGSDGDQDVVREARGSKNAEDESGTQQTTNDERARSHGSAKELEDRIQKMKEERLKKKSESASEVEAWVSRSRKLAKERVLHLSKKFEEQDNMNEEENDDGDDNVTQHATHNLSGVKVLHGIDKVLEGGAVVLTLKDQSILAGGGVNEDLDVLENIEIGEQKRRNEAYKGAAKKKGAYVDKFNDDPDSEKKMLPQYDDPIAEEGITLDASGHFTGEAEKKLEELRRRIQGVSSTKNFEDLNAPGKLLSDYYTQDEMLQFKKPKKKKSLRKREKLDIDALEEEAISAGLGVGDLGSRNESKLQASKEQKERNDAKIRSSAYQSALAKADEASKTLRRQGKTPLAESVEVDVPAIGDDEDLQNSLARARKIALSKQGESVKSGPQALAILASSMTNESGADNQNSVGAESQEKKIVFTEMEGFFLALQQDEARAPDAKDVFMEEDDVPNIAEETKEEDSVWSEVKESVKDELPENKEEEMAPDETIHEVAVGKGLAGALKLLKERGSLKESVEWGGRNMDKKKSKLAGIYDDEGPKEIHIERTDEYGRILTPKESFRLLSHKFHGKGPGKGKQEKRQRQYQEELKVKQMANSDTPTHSVERMREAQAQQKSPYLVLSGHVKPGQNSDPRSGFATVEKDFPGGLTPMLGDKKVEYFLGKRKSEPDGDTGSQKKPKT